MAVSDWSTTPASNDTQPGINWAEGQTAASVNNSARQMMADIATWYALINPFYTAGNGNLIAPSGTKMVFQQTAAPTGWTKDTSSDDDQALRFTTGTVSSGGTTAFTTLFAATSATEGHSLTIAELASHGHTATVTDPGHAHGYADHEVVSGGNFIGSNTAALQNNTLTPTTDAATTGISVSNASTGSGTAHTHTMKLAVKYVDVIVASKDA